MQAPVAHLTFPPEAVYQLSDSDSGLEAVIVLHSTRFGPAAGGCRVWRYENRQAMNHDALRLAEGMAYKNVMAELPLGGGKSVINLPIGDFDRSKLFRAFGRKIQELKGQYVTAEDVGTSVRDMETIHTETPFVAGLTPKGDLPGGDPSPWTALGVFKSMQTAARYKFGSDLAGLSVAVQGLGHVGSALCELLHQAGARLIVAETQATLAANVASKFGAEVVSPSAILSAQCDVFAPCAMGAVLTSENIAALKARVVCGAANNILATGEAGDILAERDVLYAPDYVVNAGGIINVCAEYFGWSVSEVNGRVVASGERLAQVFRHAEETGLAPHRAADALARGKLALGSRATVAAA
ncbi:Glu/Leu/Phe/Val dehydrogenase [Altererythrobacter sp. SALINAS58]|uniref:Glu/Leu/Phe/Val family dehydrogenase n=1 Tax=Alteripontixanthobacter muriae TaxID=2705546 RepID=UPI001577257C|nr:Glu/Leu/Phe/Val dehydrogenase [Alteripontixanthobacter muriae]NTZ43282.1 Glu/Leu/Phe/Val dehydrogenase [Alteripontixanthobacter muriae]